MFEDHSSEGGKQLSKENPVEGPGGVPVYDYLCNIDWLYTRPDLVYRLNIHMNVSVEEHTLDLGNNLTAALACLYSNSKALRLVA